MPLCCREVPDETEEPISNETLTSLSGRFGDLRNCDMPMGTIESLVDGGFNFTENVNLCHYLEKLLEVSLRYPEILTTSALESQRNWNRPS